MTRMPTIFSFGAAGLGTAAGAGGAAVGTGVGAAAGGDGEGGAVCPEAARDRAKRAIEARAACPARRFTPAADGRTAVPEERFLGESSCRSVPERGAPPTCSRQ